MLSASSLGNTGNVPLACQLHCNYRKIANQRPGLILYPVGGGRGHISRIKNVSERRGETYLRNELKLTYISKIQLVVYYQYCVLIG